MRFGLLNVGFDNLVAVHNIMAIQTIRGKLVERLIRNAKKDGTYLDATLGRVMKSIVILNNGYIIISALNTETLANRADKLGGNHEIDRTVPDHDEDTED